MYLSTVLQSVIFEPSLTKQIAIEDVVSSLTFFKSKETYSHLLRTLEWKDEKFQRNNTLESKTGIDPRKETQKTKNKNAKSFGSKNPKLEFIRVLWIFR